MHAVLEQVLESYRARLAGRPAEWCQRHPGQDERSWSVQELMEHLALVCRGASREMEKRLERGRATRKPGTMAQGVRRFTVLQIGFMPRGAQAPPMVCPGQMRWPAMSGDQLLTRFRQEMEQLDSVIDTCCQRFAEQKLASHFLLGPLRAEQWRRFQVVHCRHHLQQLRRIERAVGSPATQEEQLSA